MSDQFSKLFEELKRHVGKSQRTDLGVVRTHDFQRFAIASGNLNPIFFDPGAAKAAGYPGIVAPPLMLSAVLSWQAGPPNDSLRPDGTMGEEFAFVPLEGMRVMGGGQDLDFHAPVTDGMRISMETRVDGVDLKQGKSGQLILIHLTRVYRNADNKPLVTCRETFIAR